MRGNLAFNEMDFGKDDNLNRKKPKQDRRSGDDRRKLNNRAIIKVSLGAKPIRHNIERLNQINRKPEKSNPQ